MNQFDNNGWANIHSAAFSGSKQNLEKFINCEKERLEVTTNDELKSTPLLLAVMSGRIEIVKELISYGCQIHARNSQGHGIIELSCLRKDIVLLKFLLDNIDEQDLPVWVQLVEFIGSRDDEESLRASFAIHQLLISDLTQDEKTLYENKFISSGVCLSVLKVIKFNQSMECKLQALMTLMQVIRYQIVREQFVNNMGIELLLPLIRLTSIPELVKISVQIGNVLIVEPNGYSEKLFNSNIVSDLNKILQFVTSPVNEKLYEDLEDNCERDQKRETERNIKLQWQKPDLLKEIIKFIGDFAEINQSYQEIIGREPDCLKRISSLFLTNDNRSLLLTLITTIGKIAYDNELTQHIFLKEAVENAIINLTKIKDQSIQMSAAETIYALAKNNKGYQSQLMSKNAHKPLLMMLKKSGRNIMINEKTSLALWALTGETRESKAEMAQYIGIDIIIDFLQTSSTILQMIGSESIYVLSGGPLSQRDVIAKNNGIPPLVDLLKSSNKEIVLSCIKSIRQLCVSIGYIPHPRNQQLIILTRGLKMLVGLMRFCDYELVQVEAAYTIALVCLRNEEGLTELHNNPKFNYVYILEKMYSENVNIKLLASASLAAFAYNNLAEQKQIAMCGGIRFKSLQPFLFVNNEKERIMSAFQLVVLARVIPDEELSISTAWGLKTMVETLSKSLNPDIQELGCDCVARLCHTRAGVANGLISLGIIDVLCNFMLSYTESVRGSAAISVEYLSHYPESRRQILKRCRKDPYMMKVIKFYKSKNDIDHEFIECWRHYKKVGLPKIEIHRPQLTARMDMDIFKDFNTKQFTLFDSTSDSIDVGSLSERQILPRLPQINMKSNSVTKSISSNASLTGNQVETIQVDTPRSDSKTISFHMEETDLLI